MQCKQMWLTTIAPSGALYDLLGTDLIGFDLKSSTSPIALITLTSTPSQWPLLSSTTF